METTGYSEFHIIKFADLKKKKSDGSHQSGQNRFKRRIDGGRPNIDQGNDGDYSIGISYNLYLNFLCTYVLENPLVLVNLNNEEVALLQYILYSKRLERPEITLSHDGHGNVFFTITGGGKKFKGVGTVSTGT